MSDLSDQIRAFRQADGAALPSVRVLARHLSRAPRTVHLALRGLQEEGLVHALPRKGFFWGAGPARREAPPARSDRVAQVRERLVSDLSAGVYHPHRDLPGRAALAPIYGVRPATVGRILSELADEGTLARRGRGFALPPPPRRADQGVVLLVARCDRHGVLLLETERQTDFVKSVQREGRERGLRIVVAGWNDEEGDGAFLDQDGRPLDPERVPGVLLGALASTWLVREPITLLGRLRALRVPVSVWWEHPPEDFPRATAGAGLVGFDISFGPSSGIAVGRHLYSLGEGPVAFVSPFHGSRWSRTRLEGLREGLRGSAVAVEAFVDEGAGSAHDLHVREGGVPQGEAALRAILLRLLEDLLPLRHPVWVVVNDHAALELLSLLRARGIPRPRIVSFDNSSASDALQFDSFEFHTDGMVRQMLYHVLHPKAPLFRSGGLHEMVGRLVLRR
jgi:DNA-binding transcriptional regulator YhcF (GntR family)/DNA-binding LacI/PurR family transcriptional regulator